MADDPNKSNKPINRIGRSGATSGEDIVRQYEHLMAKETKQDFEVRQLGRLFRDKFRRAQEAVDLAKYDEVNGLGTAAEVKVAEQNLAVVEDARRSISSTYFQSKQARDISARGSLITKVNAYTSASDIRTRVNLYRGSTGALGSAQQAITGGASYFDLEKRQQIAAGSINNITGELSSLAQAEQFDRDAFLAKSGQMHDAERELAIAERGQKILKAQGQTPENQILKTQDILSKAGREDVINNAAKKAGQEGFTVKEINKEMSDLVGSLKKLKAGLDDGTLSLEEFDAKSREATEKLDELSAKKIGVVQGGGLIGGRARAAVGLAGIAASTASTIALDYELEQTNQRATFANQVNRQYQDVDQLMSGDMGALVRLTKGDTFRKAYSDNLRNRAIFFKGAEATASGVDAVQRGLIAKGEALGLDAGGANTEIMAAGQALSNTVKQGVRLGYGIEQGGYAAQAAGSAENLTKALEAIGTDALQKYYNNQRGAFDAGIGLGGARNQFQAGMTSEAARRGFAGAGLTAQEAIVLAGAGVQQIGVTEDYATLATRAGRARQAGVMGAEQYIGAVGALAGVGGGSGNLENIMRKAVQAGMENAKNLNQMVQGVVALSGQSAQSGFAVSGATTEMMTSSIQSLRLSGVNENLAAGAAQSALSKFNKATGQKGTLADLQFRATAQSIYGDINIDESMALAQLTQEQIQTIEKGGKEAYNIAYAHGLEGTLGVGQDGRISAVNKNRIKQLRRAKMKKGFLDQMGVRGYSDMEMIENMVDYGMGEGNELDSRTRAAYISLTGGARADAMRFQGAKDGQRQESSETVKNFQWQDIYKANRLNQQIDRGQKGMQQYGGIEGLTSMFQTALENASPEKMEKAVSEAAESLKTPASIFDGAAGKFQKAVNAYIQHLDKMGVAVDKEDVSNFEAINKKAKKSLEEAKKK